MEDRRGPRRFISRQYAGSLFIILLKDATRANSTGYGDPFSVVGGMRNDGESVKNSCNK